MKNALNYRGYTASIELDTDDAVLVGRALDIDDIITFHAESVADFTRAFHASVDDYLAACEKLAQAPDRPASGRLMLRVAPKVHAAALKSAARSGQSLNRWAEAVLKAAAHA